MHGTDQEGSRRLATTAAFLLASIWIAAALSITAMAQRPGSLDPSFSGDGKLIDGILHNSEAAKAVAVQSDGKIVAVGASFDNYIEGGFALARYNSDGSLDTSFDGDGLVTTKIGPQAEARSVVIQGDGKIVAAGYSNGKFAIARYNPNGSLDTSFDGDGVVLTSFGFYFDQAYSVAIQSDGKIVAAGSTTESRSPDAEDLAIARYNTDGSLDTSFDGDGRVITLIGTPTNRIYSIAIQSDGKIVAGGWGNGFGLFRYNTDGSLDSSFDGDGKVIASDGAPQLDKYEINSVAIQSDGKIVAAGTNHSISPGSEVLFRYNMDGSLDTSFDGDGRVYTSLVGSNGDRTLGIQSDGKIVAMGLGPSNPYLLAISRYNANGSYDTSFDGDGRVFTSLGTGYHSGDDAQVAIQPEGKIVIASSGLNGTGADFVLGRYNMDGSLDTSFDSDGFVVTDFGLWTGNSLRAVAIQQDGKIVTAGNAMARYNPDGTPDTSFAGTGKVFLSGYGYAVAIQPDGKAVVGGQWYDRDNDCYTVWLARYRIDGSLDTSFGTDGEVRTTDLACDEYAHSIALQPDGKILVAGGSYDPTTSPAGFAVVRYNTDGSLDQTFDSDGIVTTAIGSNAQARSVAVQSDGKIVAAGYGHPGSTDDFALVRYNPDGSLDTSFDGDGIVTTLIDATNDFADSIAIQTDGRIVAAGGSYILNSGDGDFALVRYNPDGSLDTTFDSDGRVATSALDPQTSSIAVQTDGKIVASGTSLNGSTHDFALVRFNSNGSIDTTFGRNGVSTVDFNSSYVDYAYGMTLDGQGRAVVVGESAGAFALARFLLGVSPTPFDFDGDGRSDLAVRRPSDNVWYFLRTTAGYTGLQYGVAGDMMAPADYDGDGRTDVAVFRPSEGKWYIAGSAVGFYIDGWGQNGDLPVPADYDGDGRADVAVYRPSNGTWYLKRSSLGISITQFGTAEDKPVLGDYDGDGKADLAVWRPSNNVWYFLRTTAGFTGIQWGTAGDVQAPADYDGDGRTDAAVFRPSTGVWFIAASSAGFMTQNWGANGDVPVPADYDNDGKADIAVFRPSNATWYLFRSSAGILQIPFGTAEDKQVQSSFIF
jgi:uncharacterized delta-60 repeat protein